MHLHLRPIDSWLEFAALGYVGNTNDENISERKWLYQTPLEILIKASNGASDFGNKFGQPLISGSVFTFENETNGEIQAYDKVIMLAGGIGYANKDHSLKKTPEKDDLIVIMNMISSKINVYLFIYPAPSLK